MIFCTYLDIHAIPSKKKLRIHDPNPVAHLHGGRDYKHDFSVEISHFMQFLAQIFFVLDTLSTISCKGLYTAPRQGVMQSPRVVGFMKPSKGFCEAPQKRAL